jgi:hypothetical protein
MRIARLFDAAGPNPWVVRMVLAAKGVDLRQITKVLNVVGGTPENRLPSYTTVRCFSSRTTRSISIYISLSSQLYAPPPRPPRPPRRPGHQTHPHIRSFTRTHHHAQLNVAGSTPFMQLEDGTILAEVVCSFACQQAGGRSWIRCSPGL